MTTFEELGLDPAIIDIVKRAGYKEPTGIQEKAIPLILDGEDVIGGSATGSGKTFAFGSGIIHHIIKGDGIQGLVLVPTRELAEQVYEALKLFAAYKKLSVARIYGGVSFGPQLKALEKAEIVVATPGRLLDHMRQENIFLDNVHHLVLDEADMMLDMGFIPDVQQIIKACPENRQTLLFSATIPPQIKDLADRFLYKPVKVSHETYVDPSKLAQYYYVVPRNLKLSLAVHLLQQEMADVVMIFCNSRIITERVAKGLKNNGVNAEAIHGGLSQARRNTLLEKFHAGRLQVLICTDVAARGLDINDVSHVYNYDIPKDSKQYVHRIGRTARAGKEGMVFNILSDQDYDNFNRVLNETQFNIQEMPLPSVKKIDMPRNAGGRDSRDDGRGRPSSGGRFGGRSDGRSRDGNRGGSRDGGRGRPSGRNDGNRSSGNRSSGPRTKSRDGNREGGNRSEGRGRNQSSGNRGGSRDSGRGRPSRPVGNRPQGSGNRGPSRGFNQGRKD